MFIGQKPGPIGHGSALSWESSVREGSLSCREVLQKDPHTQGVLAASATWGWTSHPREQPPFLPFIASCPSLI